MARYLLEVGVKPEVFGKLMKNPDDRAKATRPVFEAFGGSLDEYYFAVGQKTVYLIGEMPDEVSVEATTIAVLAGGAIDSIKFTPILTAVEAMEAMEKAANAMYRPPSV
jgi:uncharacterized protein with GYD domain